ncbi:MAG: hypothetical protein QNK37_07715 [Acidobacteriota bacterium]|nr:hypothetical protein [Acidobacteriota bacterium]
MIEKVQLKGGSLILQALLVVFSVILALTVNEFWRSRQLQSQASEAKIRILAEIAANLEKTGESLTYHENGLAKLQAARVEKTPPDWGGFDKGFVHPAKLTRTAWDAARMADLIPHMDYDDVLLFSEFYEMQEDYRRQEDMAGQAIFSLLLDQGIHGMNSRTNNLWGIIYSFKYTESNMIKRGEEILDAMGNPNH